MKNILVIEDDDNLRFHVCQFLRKQNFHVIAAENAHIGMQLFQEQYPDLIICDLDLPEPNSYQFLEKLHENSTDDKIPVIFLISKPSEFHRQQARQLGANIWLKKPVRLNEMLWAIAIQLNKASEK